MSAFEKHESCKWCRSRGVKSAFWAVRNFFFVTLTAALSGSAELVNRPCIVCGHGSRHHDDPLTVEVISPSLSV